MQNAFILIFGCGLLALVYGLLTVRQILKMPVGTQRMQDIAAAIQEGAQAYLNRQYMTVAVVGAVICVALGLLLGWHVAIGFLVGSILSAAAGYVGMNISVRANVRTAA